MSQTESREQGWEIYPSVDIEFGKRLLAETHDEYGREQMLTLEVDTEAITGILNDVMAPDAQPGVVHFHLADEPKESENSKILGIKVGGTASQNNDGSCTVSINMDAIPSGGLNLAKYYIGRTVIHELIHAADFASPSIMKQQRNFERKLKKSPKRILWNIMKSFSTISLQSFKSYRGAGTLAYPLYETDNNRSEPDQLSIHLAHELTYNSPIETRAYQLENTASLISGRQPINIQKQLINL